MGDEMRLGRFDHSDWVSEEGKMGVMGVMGVIGAHGVDHLRRPSDSDWKKKLKTKPSKKVEDKNNKETTEEWKEPQHWKRSKREKKREQGTC
jgi:hypothetical protein